MTYLIYFIVIILANTIGAVSGMGGGVIIKPVLDILHFHSLTAIAFYSSVAVFTMSIASTYKQYKNGIQVNWLSGLFLSIGSLIGGIAGDTLLNQLITILKSEATVQVLQNTLLIITLLIVIGFTKSNSENKQFQSLLIYTIIGVLLGVLSTFLGIGGGPINVALLMFCFNFEMKQATVYSIITIFFSQIAKLGNIAFTTGFSPFDLSYLLVIIPAAIIGGYLGGSLSSKLNEKQIRTLYIYVVLSVIGISCYNLFQAFY